MLHGTSAALRRFKKEFPELKWSTANDLNMQSLSRRSMLMGDKNKLMLVDGVNKKRTVTHGSTEKRARSRDIKNH